MPQTTYRTPTGQLPAYLARPQGTGPWPGVVVVQDALGMSDDLRTQADTLAAAGYLALAPDLYGRGGRKLRCMRLAFSQLKTRSGPAFDDIEAARDFLKDQPECTGRIGVIGFCLGGSFALLTAAHRGFAAASVNYGEVPEDATDLLAGSCPVVASYGGRDKSCTAMPQRLGEALEHHRVPHEIKVYPEAGHGFMNQGSGVLYALTKTASATTARIGYHPDSAADSWRRILTFFGEHLASPPPR